MPPTPASRRTADIRRRLVLAASLVFAWGAAAAQELTVFAATSFKPVLAAMTPAFEKRDGVRVVVVTDAAGALAQRIRTGQPFDLAVLPEALLETLAEEGAVAGGSITALARERGAPATLYAGAMSVEPGNPQAAMSLLVLLASEDTQGVLVRSGLSAP